ncbi:MAG: bifunctional nuclease family protein [Deltaproteobacteria bacterium]|nr:bifunctional nuclease family protein [Deltaproteobacteria bacterium]
MKKTVDEVEMFVAGLVLDPATNAPIVILKDPNGDKCLPIWIGLAEATAIVSAVKKVQVARPMTHDLLRNVIEELNGNVVRIVISALQENTFLASIEIRVGETLRVIDARPSDAIALGVRVSAPILVARAVLEEAQVALVSVNPDEMEDLSEEVLVQEVEGKNFANIEKDKWAEILAEMDPDDFKYKM